MQRKLCLSVIASIALLQPLALRAEDQPADVLTVDSFEKGTEAPEGWEQGADIDGVKYSYEENAGSQGKRSLSLQKTANRYFPIAGWSRTFKHDSGKQALSVAAKVKANKATKAVIDVQFLDAQGEMLGHEWAAYIGQKKPSDRAATHDWKKYDGAVKIPAGTKQIALSLQIYGPGTVWFDELEARYVDSVKKTDAAK